MISNLLVRDIPRHGDCQQGLVNKPLHRLTPCFASIYRATTASTKGRRLTLSKAGNYMAGMKLLDWAHQNRVDAGILAGRINEGLPPVQRCTKGAAKKWMYGERIPSPRFLLQIERVTGGAVTLRDFISEPPANKLPIAPSPPTDPATSPDVATHRVPAP